MAIKHISLFQTIPNSKRQTGAFLPGLSYRSHSDTFFLALPVHEATKHKREFHTRSSS